MQLHSATQNLSSAVSCPQSSTSACQFCGQKVTAVGAETTRLMPLPDTATDQHKRQCLARDMASLPDQPTEIGVIQCKELFQLTIDGWSSPSLNRDHSRLIVQDREARQTHIWQADRNGSFAHGLVFDFKVTSTYDGQDDPDILFVPCPDLVEVIDVLAIYERNATGEWVKAQVLTVDDLVDDPPQDKRSHFLFWDHEEHITYSNDSSSVVCLAAGSYGTILGRGADGLWMNRGRCMQYSSAVFSADNNHIALSDDDKLSLMSKNADGFWSETGGINLGFGELQLAFSPDSRHFVSWFERTGEDEDDDARFDYDDYGRNDFFLMLFSLDEQGQWTEKQRITKYLSEREAKCPLKARFSPDGKHLAVCSRYDFDIWTLNKDNCWTPVLEAMPYHQEHSIKSGKYSVINFVADSSMLMVVNDDSATVWALQDSGQWNWQHNFRYQRTFRPRISPDAKAIVCETEHDKKGLWRQKDGLWVWQDINGSIKQPRFNRDGSILAFIDQDEEALVLMAPARSGIWEEKNRLQFKGTVQRFEFNPSGRAVQVTCEENYKQVLSFWGF